MWGKRSAGRPHTATVDARSVPSKGTMRLGSGSRNLARRGAGGPTGIRRIGSAGNASTSPVGGSCRAPPPCDDWNGVARSTKPSLPPTRLRVPAIVAAAARSARAPCGGGHFPSRDRRRNGALRSSVATAGLLRRELEQGVPVHRSPCKIRAPPISAPYHINGCRDCSVRVRRRVTTTQCPCSLRSRTRVRRRGRVRGRSMTRRRCSRECSRTLAHHH